MPDASSCPATPFEIVQQDELRSILLRRVNDTPGDSSSITNANAEFLEGMLVRMSALDARMRGLIDRLKKFDRNQIVKVACRGAVAKLEEIVTQVRSSSEHASRDVCGSTHRDHWIKLDQFLEEAARHLGGLHGECMAELRTVAKQGSTAPSELESIAAATKLVGRAANQISMARSSLAQARADILPSMGRCALRNNLVGMAISGGGIRSATFGLGMLQALAELDLLKHFDYLSTVSGGGYIGGWFQACLRRAKSLDPMERVRQLLLPDRTENAETDKMSEPAPIKHLRRFSNYLTPKIGLFSADSWVVVAIYLRNLLATQFHLIVVLLTVLVLQRVVIRIFDLGVGVLWSWITAGATFLFLMVAAAFVAWMTVKSQTLSSREATLKRPIAQSARGPRWTFQLGIVVPLLVAAASATWIARWKDPLARCVLADLAWCSWALVTLPFACFVLIVTLICILAYCRAQKSKACDVASNIGKGSWKGFLSGLVCGSILYLGLYVIHKRCASPQLAAMAGPTLLIVIVALNLAIVSAFQQSDLSEGTKEWFASLSGWLLLYATVWLVVFLVPIYGGYFVLWLIQPGIGGAAVQYALGAGWVGSTLLGVLAGKSRQTGDRAEPTWIDRGIEFLPHVFLAGMVIILSIAVGGLFEELRSTKPAQFFDAMTSPNWRTLALTLGGGIIASVFFGWIYRVNGFSLHSMYANRLTRCYLGASRLGDLDRDEERRADAVTGFDDGDELSLDKLLVGKDSNKRPLGPFPIVNTALNLVGGDELAWQERKAESFTFTPLACGAKGTGYSLLSDVLGGQIKLGEAVAISGAAVSPNMGYHSSPSVAALLSAFNARLGGWYPNPKGPRHKHRVIRWFTELKWVRCLLGKGRKLEPTFGSLYFFRELFGLTTSADSYVYLSDGGHFENLGIYELVRRRCRFILASDAGADPAFSFWDLGSMIRKVRVDFGIRIDIDTSALRPNPQTGKNARHCAVGRIRYSDVDERAPDGILLYLKPSLTGDEPSDVLNYAADNPTFPHEDTVDQWFSESQFESYRALGFHVTSCALEAAVREVEEHGDVGGVASIGRVFAAARRRWLVQPFDYDEKFLQLTERYTRIHESLASGGDLEGISAQIYPEAGKGAERAEIHVVCAMLQLMEDAWTGLRLDGKFDHAQNRGWLAVFRRWATSPLVRKHWVAVRGEFGQDFVRFCEREFSLSAGEIVLTPIAKNARDLPEMAKVTRQEFNDEWSERIGDFDILDELRLCAENDRAWWVQAKRPADGGITHPIGFLLFRDISHDGRDALETLLWLAPAYRNLRLGAKALRRPEGLPAAQALANGRPLIVRYPKSKNKLVNERIERHAWQSFFEGFEFRKVEEKHDDAFVTLIRKP